MSPNYVMNTKAGDYRILIANEEILANPDYIPITEKEFQAMTKGHVTGPKILQNRFLQERIEQAKAAGLNVKDLGEEDEPPAAPEPPPAAPEFPPVPLGDGPPVNTKDPVDAESFMNGKSSNDLKAIGKTFGFEFTVETRREMATKITEKMNGK